MDGFGDMADMDFGLAVKIRETFEKDFPDAGIEPRGTFFKVSSRFSF